MNCAKQTKQRDQETS